MQIVSDLLQSASHGILSIFEHPITFIAFVFFLIWASINDFKTMKVRDYQNVSFLITGVIIYIISNSGIYDMGFNLGNGHIYGAITGFLLLFVPGMILNYAFGGDIKFVAVMGFWTGPVAILLILIIATALQFFVLSGKSIITKNYSLKNNLPFAPAFTLAYFIALGILLIL